jgi:cyclomaltodextrinase / maltogenic alpha-amylase / neopullulanase
MSLTPDWVKDAVFYQIFPDRFAQSHQVAKSSNLEPWSSKPTPHGYKGGDLLGVVEKLDHLEALGVNAIYFCPVFQSGANHRYHTHDYLNVDPMLGGNAALEELIRAAHTKGMRVVLDGVFNHASRGFFQFHDILENGSQSAYLDWFHVRNYPLHAYESKQPPNYDAWWGYPALPKFNTDTPAVREFLWGVAEHWIKFGVDGWRLDVPNEIDDDEFWREFRRRVKGANPDAYIVGEIWETAERWLKGDQFDAVMNYVFSSIAYDFLAGSRVKKSVVLESGYKHLGGSIDAKRFALECERLMALYPWDITLAQLNLLGSHDTPRILSIIGHDLPTLKLLLILQMGFPGAPCVYYGDEIGLEGERDPDCRRGMPWEESAWNQDVLEFTKRAIDVRKTIPALRRGSFKILHAEGMTAMFERQHDSSRAIIALNAGEQPAHLELNGQYRDAFTGARVEGQLELPARSGTILEGI